MKKIYYLSWFVVLVLVLSFHVSCSMDGGAEETGFPSDVTEEEVSDRIVESVLGSGANNETFKKLLMKVYVPAEPGDKLLNEIYSNFGTMKDLNKDGIEEHLEMFRKICFEQYKAVYLYELNKNGESRKKSAKEAAKDDYVLAAHVAVLKTELLLEISDDERVWEAMARDALEIKASLYNDGHYPMYKESADSIKTALFNKHYVHKDERGMQHATDLWNEKENRYYFRNELEAIVQSGKDTSEINPRSTYWKNPQKDISKVDLVNDLNEGYEAPSEVYFKSVRATEFSPKLNVYSRVKKVDPETGMLENKKMNWKLKMGAEVHSDYVAPKIFAALGFPQDITLPKRNVKVYLPKGMSFKDFLIDYGTYFKPKTIRTPIHKLIKEKGKEGDRVYIIFHKVLFEARPKNLERIGPWGWSELGHQDKRAVRGLAIINAWINNSDVKNRHQQRLLFKKHKDGGIEIVHSLTDPGFAFGSTVQRSSVNAFPWDLVKKPGFFDSKKVIKLKYKRYHVVEGDDPHNKITYSDAKWLIRMLGQLTKKQLRDVFAASGWPAPVAAIYVEKMSNRRNQLVEAFGLKNELGLHHVKGAESLDFSSEDASIEFVKDGVLKYNYNEKGTPEYHPEGMLRPFWDDFYSLALEPYLQGIIGLFEEARASLSTIEFFSLETSAIGDLMWEKLFVGGRVRLYRKVRMNPKPTSDLDKYLVFDVLRVEVRLGTGIFYDILTNDLPLALKAYGTVGREYAHMHSARNWREGYNKDFLNIVRLARELSHHKVDLKSLNFEEGERIRISNFFGPELKLQIQEAPSGFGPGAEVSGRYVYTSRTNFIKANEKEIAVWWEKLEEFELEASIFLRLGYIVKFSLTKYVETEGELDRRVFVFNLDPSNPDFLGHQLSLAEVMGRNDYSLAEELNEISELHSDYSITRRKLNLIFYKKDYKLRLDDVEYMDDELSAPDYFLNGELFMGSELSFTSEETKQVFANFNIDINDEDKETVESMYARIGFFIYDSDTDRNEVKAYIDALNTSVSDNFIDFDATVHPEQKRWESTYTTLNIHFSQKGIENIFSSTDEDIDAAREFTNSKILNNNYKIKKHLFVGAMDAFINGSDEDVLYLDGEVRFKVSTKAARIVKKYLKKINLAKDWKGKREYFLKMMKKSAKRLGTLRLLIYLAGLENVYVQGGIEGQFMPANVYNVLGDPENAVNTVRELELWEMD